MHEHETYFRSVIKSITWRVVATSTTIILVFIFTGHVALALGVGFVEIVAKFILFFLHERVWDRMAWGKVLKNHH